MKAAFAVAIAITTLTSVPLLAQDAETDTNASVSANNSAKVTYAATAGGFGDQSASRAYEMSTVTAELEGKLDSNTAKVGDRVVLKTTEKVQSPDGTVIPRGSRLVGHITEVHAYSKEHGAAQMGIAFDRAELKNGQSIAIHSLIRGVSPVAGVTAASMNDDAMMNSSMGGGRMGGGQGAGLGHGSGVLGGAGETLGGAGDLAGGTLSRTTDTAASASDRTGADLGSSVNTATEGSGSLTTHTGAHEVAAARAVPHATAFPGVMLAGNSSSSGVLLASRKNIQFDSGTQLQLGVVADR